MSATIKPGFLAPPGTLSKKPPHGAPCNRCGLCCVATICPLGSKIFGSDIGPCPALERRDDGTTDCGLVVNPAVYAPARAFTYGRKALSEAAVKLIGSGDGCDARFNGEPINAPFYDKLKAIERKTRSAIRTAKQTWGFK